MVRIRLAGPPDAEAVRDIYAPYVAETPVSFEEDLPDVEEVCRRIETTTERYPWLVCVSDDAVVGYAYAGQHRSRAAYRWSVDVSVYVAEPVRRKGVATGLYTALFEALRAQRYVNAYAATALPNPASTGFHAAMGFEPVGTYEEVGYTQDDWHDVQWWVRRLAERESDPAEPIPVTENIGSSEWADALVTGEDLISE